METLDKKTKQTLVRKTIWLCWFALIGCFIIKLFGGNYFEIFSKNETFVNLCNWIDGNIFKKIIRFIFLNMTFFLYCSSIMRKRMNWKQVLISISSLLLVEIIKCENSTLGFIADCLVLTAIPLIFSKWNVRETIIGFILMNVFQIISMITRNISFGILDETILIEVILQIDYYIMLILYYLYLVKLKGEKMMGHIGFLWFGNDMAMDRGYAKFIKVMALFGIVITFPISVPYLLWKKHKRNKVVKAKV